ncbi:unnamed protein product [Gordionus sp. m RMFG-2023]
MSLLKEFSFDDIDRKFMVRQIKFSSYLSNFPQIEESPNYVFSPVNLEIALSILNMGSKKCAVSIQGLSKKFQYFKISNMLKALKGKKQDGNLTLKMNNDIYAKANMELNLEYVKNVSKFFDASVESVDFQRDLKSVINKINEKVSKNTNGLIKDLIKSDQVDPSTQLMSVNSLYFKGLWKQPFDKKMVNMPFRDKSGFNLSIPMLRGKDMSLLISGVNSLKARIIVKDYIDEDFKLVLVQPYSNISLSMVEKNIIRYPKKFVDGIANASEIIGFLYMPNFDEEFEVPILDMLAKDLICWKKGGMDNIEKGSHLDLTQINHKVKLEITAEGSKGAAVVQSSIIGRSLQLPPIIRMNSPFLFFIVRIDGSILFRGRYSSPNNRKLMPVLHR